MAGRAPSQRTARSALERLRTAYLLLLANHGQITTLVVRQAADTEIGLFDGVDAAELERAWSGDVVSRYGEAELHVKSALQMLGVEPPARGASPELLDGGIAFLEGYTEIALFDLLALRTHLQNYQRNEAFAREIQRLFEAIRNAEPTLVTVAQLPSFDNDTGSEGVDAVLDKVGLAVGSPRFWSRSRWVASVLLVLLPLLIGGGIFGMIQYSFHDSAVYREVVRRLSTSPAWQATLGAPIEPGWLVTGSIGDDSVDMTIPVQGPRASGRLHVVAARDERGWVISESRLEAP